MTGLPVSRLPQTILDAFQTAARLGFRYIWIDSLCIIQDDVEDKLREISQMTTIYKQSALTIIAANARSVADGFLGPRRDFISSNDRIPFLCNDGTLGTVTLSTSRPSMPYWPDANPIEQRAWTYQERLLAPRALIYSDNGLRFVCRSAIESSVQGTQWIESHREPAYVEISCNDAWMWRDLVEEYSKRSMSDPGDKSLAISGLARAHAKGRDLGDDYLAGLWRKSIAVDLLWQSDYEKTVDDGVAQRAPSWSWVSTDPTVTWPVGLRRLDPRSISPDFELLSVEVMPRSGHDMYGQIDNACLQLRGHICHLTQDSVKELGWGSSPVEGNTPIWRPSPLLPNPRTLDGLQTRPDGQTWLFDSVTSSRFRMSFDSDEAGCGDIFLLLIVMHDPGTESGSECAEPEPKVFHGLIVERLSKTAENQFKRAGVFEFRSDRGPPPSCIPKPSIAKESSLSQSYDFSCLWSLGTNPIRSLTII